MLRNRPPRNRPNVDSPSSQVTPHRRQVSRNVPQLRLLDVGSVACKNELSQYISLHKIGSNLRPENPTEPLRPGLQAVAAEHPLIPPPPPRPARSEAFFSASSGVMKKPTFPVSGSSLSPYTKPVSATTIAQHFDPHSESGPIELLALTLRAIYDDGEGYLNWEERELQRGLALSPRKEPTGRARTTRRFASYVALSIVDISMLIIRRTCLVVDLQNEPPMFSPPPVPLSHSGRQAWPGLYLDMHRPVLENQTWILLFH